MGKKRKRQLGLNAGNRQEQSTQQIHIQSEPNSQRSKRKTSGMDKLTQLAKVPTKINLVVVGTGGPGTSRSLLLTTEYTRYMFNCGEGSRRLISISRSLRQAAYAKVSGIENIFITYKNWENIGGLLGMAMTLENQKNTELRAYGSREKDCQAQTSSTPKITIYGPPDVEKIAMMAKKFAVSANLNIAKGEGKYEDLCVTITPVAFYNNLDHEQNPAKRQRINSECKINDVAYCYIVQAKPPQPKINVEKCVDAGVTIGPMVGLLQRGHPVTLDDGTVIRPEQVTDMPVMDNRPFLILDCPSTEFLPSLMRCCELQDYTKTDVDKRSFSVIVHMTPKHVYDSTIYQAWMESFHVSTDHLLMNSEAVGAELTRVREHQTLLNLVSSEIFPLLPAVEHADKMEVALQGKNSGEDDENEIVVMTPETELMLSQKKGQVAVAFSGLIYVSRGKLPGFHAEIDEFNYADLRERYLSKLDFKDQLDKLEAITSTESASDEDKETEDKDFRSKYPRVVFLGTGSSEPNKIRAQSCILVHLSKHTVIMLDCGEDSYGQLYRFYGSRKTNRILRKLKAIFISHMHGDHHLGLITLMKERKTACDVKNKTFSPLLLVAPVQMKRWIKFYHTEIDDDITTLFRFVKIQTWLNDFGELPELKTASFEEVLQELDLSEFTPVPVEHCNNAFGISFRQSSGFKLVYSGDTMPCEALVKAGEKCDLLIHEATHEDSLSSHAKVSKHSTFSQAIDIGKKMEAKHIILTHFSQRYSHMVPLYKVELPDNVGVAFDNMQVNPQTVKYLPKLIPALTELFFDELQKSASKTLKYDRNNEKLEMAAKDSL
ncbi:ribonuclease Z, mitochondrial [Biomphalaria glabrata]|nr:ribonuclease Z, mitochondrial [Biomphalaria glabrata]